MSPPPGARLLGWLLATALRLQALTWRKRTAGLERIDALLAARRGFIAVFWHGKYLPLFALLRGRVPGARIFTSRSFRGAVIAEVSRRFGYRAVAIPARGGTASLALMREALAGAPAGAIAVDGPLGPYHAVKRGAIELASELGLALLPVAVAARRKRIATARWDRMEFPRLFSRVHLAAGEPIAVPPGLDEAGVERWSARVHDALEALDARLAAATDA